MGLIKVYYCRKKKLPGSSDARHSRTSSSSQWLTWRNGPAEMVSADLAKSHLLTDWSGISLLSLCCQTASHLLLSQLITVSGWTSAAPGTVSPHHFIFFFKKKKKRTWLCCHQRRKCPLSETRVTVSRYLEKKVTGEKKKSLHTIETKRQDKRLRQSGLWSGSSFQVQENDDLFFLKTSV